MDQTTSVLLILYWSLYSYWSLYNGKKVHCICILIPKTKILVRFAIQQAVLKMKIANFKLRKSFNNFG